MCIEIVSFFKVASRVPPFSQGIETFSHLNHHIPFFLQFLQTGNNPIFINLSKKGVSIAYQCFDNVFARQTGFILKCTFAFPLGTFISQHTHLKALIVIHSYCFWQLSNESLKCILVEPHSNIFDFRNTKNSLKTVCFDANQRLHFIYFIRFVSQFHKHLTEISFSGNDSFE